MFRRNRAKPAQQPHAQPLSTMGKSGLNLKDLAEFMNPAFALSNENYFVTNNRGLTKRKGLMELITVAGDKPVTLFGSWKGYHIFGYETTVAAYNPITDTVTYIKTNWATNAAFSGAVYGDYFLVGNTGNKIHYITESAGVFAITEIAAAPMSGVIQAIGPRLYAGVGTDVYYCVVDDGSNPPFQTWTISSDASSGGKVSFRNAGTVRSICSLGDIIIAFGDTGKYAFRLTITNDGAGTVVKIEDIVIDRVDMGGARGAITTPKGVFYVNEAGLWQLMSLGQSNIPFSDQETLTSVNLGTDYFTDVDLSNCDLTYYARYSTVLITCAKESVQNNHIITFNPEIGAFSTFRNWNINRWMKVDDDIFGGSSIKTTLYHCFAGNSDNGISIGTDYLQEITIGSPFTRKMLYGAYIKGLVHSLSSIHVDFDIYNVQGITETDKLEFIWTAQSNMNLGDEWGRAAWGGSAWGGDADNSGLIESFDGMHQFIRNFQRIRIHITESSKLSHQIDWFSLDARVKANIRRRKMVLQS